VNNALIPALLLLAVPLGLLAARFELLRHRTIRWATIALFIGVVILEFPAGVDDPSLNRFKLVLSGTLALFFCARHLGWMNHWARSTWLTWLTAAAFASVTLYTDFFAFHGTPGFIHWHEVTHYYLGAKYFDELGYGNLYAALARADKEDTGPPPDDRLARDLATNRLVPARQLADDSDAVRARFGGQRWESFRRDAAVFRQALGAEWPHVLVDHGYNPTPIWTLIGAPIANLVPAGNRAAIELLTVLDPILLIVAAAAVTWGFGFETTLLSICYFGVIFGTAFGWTGGAYLRFIWFTSTVSAVACLARNRHATAGALFALAASLRIFPALFAVPIALRAAAELRAGARVLPHTRRFIAGFALTCFALFAASLFLGPGWSGWQQFIHNSRVYADNLGQNLVGLTGIVTAMIGRFLVAGSGDQVATRLFDLRTAIQRVQLFAILPLAMTGVAILAQRVSDVRAAAFGVWLIFASLNPACYYFSFLVLLLLADPRRFDRISLFFAVEFATYLLSLFESQPMVLYFYRSALMFWLLVFLTVDELATPRTQQSDPMMRVGFDGDLTLRSAAR
jgi:hypothetical protein